MSDNGDDMDSAVQADIMDGVQLVAEGIPGGKARVTVYYTGGDGRDVLFSGKKPKEFYTRNPRGKIKNDVKEALEDYPLDADAWVKAWKGWCAEILENEDSAAVEVVAESVRALAEGTQEVRNGKAGDERIWEIDLEWNGDTGQLRFDAGDMANGGVASLKTQMFTEFGNCPPGIENEEWDSLKSYWLDIQTEAYEETVTERDRAVEMFMSKLRERVTPYDDAQALERDKQSAWLDDGNEYGIETNPLVGGLDGVVWVRSDLVNQIIDEMDNAPRIGELAQELQEAHHVVAGSNTRKPDEGMTSRRYWFFDPDSLNITTVHEWDADDETGVVDP